MTTLLRNCIIAAWCFVLFKPALSQVPFKDCARAAGVQAIGVHAPCPVALTLLSSLSSRLYYFNVFLTPPLMQVPSRTALGLLVSKLLVHPLLGLGGVFAALHTGLLPSDTDPLMVLVMLLVWATPTAVLTHSLATMLQVGGWVGGSGDLMSISGCSVGKSAAVSLLSVTGMPCMCHALS